MTSLAKLLEEALRTEVERQEAITRDQVRAQIIAASTTADADAVIEEALDAIDLAVESVLASIHGKIRIRLKEHAQIVGDGWTAQSDLRPGYPYTYATEGILVTVDWE